MEINASRNADGSALARLVSESINRMKAMLSMAYARKSRLLRPTTYPTLNVGKRRLHET